MRESGVLFPIFSVPSKFGIGSFSREAYEFVDFLEKSGQGFWQILPIGPTGFGDSPYQNVSAFAGNPYFISLETLIEDGLLTWDEVNAQDFGSDETKVDYGAIYESRRVILKKAYEKFAEKLEASKKDKSVTAGSPVPKGISMPETAKKDDKKEKKEIKEKSLAEEFDAFLEMERYWLEDYALFMALKEKAGGASWLDWEDDLRTRDEKALEKAKKDI